MSSPQADLPQKLNSDPYRIGLGTYQLGGDTLSVCLRALDLGYRHIDTASLYRNEGAVGEAIKQFGISRNDLFVTTKVWTQDVEDSMIPEALETSLEHLGAIDLVLLHGPTTCLDEDWNILCEQAEKHDIPYVGVSNFKTEHLQMLNGLVPCVNQIEITPFLPRTELVNYCRMQGIITSAHSPLAKGRRLENPVLNSVAKRHRVSVAQVMIAWSLAKGHIPLVRSRNGEHLQQNIGSSNLPLSPRDIYELDQLEDGYATHPQHLRSVKPVADSSN